MEEIINYLNDLIVDVTAIDLQRRIIVSVILLVVLWLLSRIAHRWVDRRIADEDRQYRWQKGITYGYYALILVSLGLTWFEGLAGLFAFLGLLAAGVAIALRDPLANLAGWAFILWRQPFVVGDRIEIDDAVGDVVDVRFFNFSLLEVGNWVDADQPTGRLINVPNGKVFTDTLANYTVGFKYLWNEVPVLVTFESDWKKAKAILEEIAHRHGQELPREAQKQFRLSASKFKYGPMALEPRVFTKVEDSGVMLTIRYICPARRRRTTAEAVWEDVLEAFALHADIDFAYPTQRFYDARTEGKEAQES